jgi:large subunit ribosomal protein L25
MYILNAEERDISRKAKQLKKSGLIPGSVSGSKLDGSLLIQLHQNDVQHLLKEKTTGNKVTLCVKEKKYDVVIKEIGRSPIGNQIEHICFQSMANNEVISSTARIVLINKEKVSNFIQQRIYEIPYRAFSSNLVEITEIDLEGMPAGTYVRVKDLDIARNENVELLIEPESLVLTIDGGRKQRAD